MAEDENIDLFNTFASIYFDMLYKNFPIPITIDVGNIAKELCKIQSTDKDRCEKVGRYTLEWLYKSGFIEYSQSKFINFSNCILTTQGLNALNATPSSIDNEKSIGKEIVDAVKEKSIDSAITFAQSALVAFAKQI